jgi:hypothetical protein
MDMPGFIPPNPSPIWFGDTAYSTISKLWLFVPARLPGTISLCVRRNFFGADVAVISDLKPTVPSLMLTQAAHMLGFREKALPLKDIGSPQQIQMVGCNRSLGPW